MSINNCIDCGKHITRYAARCLNFIISKKIIVSLLFTLFIISLLILSGSVDITPVNALGYGYGY